VTTRAFIELLDGQGAHASPLGCLEDLSAPSAAERVPGFPHSIFDLVFHINYWMDYDLRRMRGERPPYPKHASEGWPPPDAAISDDQWRDMINTSRTLLRQMAELAKSSPQDLAREIEPLHPQHTQRASTLGDLLWQTLVHNSYHVGQIAMLRRMLSLWPPRRRGHVVTQAV